MGSTSPPAPQLCCAGDSPWHTALMAAPAFTPSLPGQQQAGSPWDPGHPQGTRWQSSEMVSQTGTVPAGLLPVMSGNPHGQEGQAGLPASSSPSTNQGRTVLDTITSLLLTVTLATQALSGAAVNLSQRARGVSSSAQRCPEALCCRFPCSIPTCQRCLGRKEQLHRLCPAGCALQGAAAD